MKKILSLCVVAALLAINIGCGDNSTGTKKTETHKIEPKSGGKVQTTDEKKQETKQDGKTVEKKDEKKVEVK